MRIQHNILAMNAYRNYTNNTSALSKNLEKLSSGYKINRAGDDAAGLAISEKMRAQITGLSAAQKNVKDGVSLVKTAEGALSEVHDMLNRMVYLATQSANGTYDGTDRVQLQKELDQLRTEINRISEASNFNGIKLLDGSMDTSGGVKNVDSLSRMLQQVGTGAGNVGRVTILDSDPSIKSGNTVFDIDFAGLTTSKTKAPAGGGGGEDPASYSLDGVTFSPTKVEFTLGLDFGDQTEVNLQIGDKYFKLTNTDAVTAANETGSAASPFQINCQGQTMSQVYGAIVDKLKSVGANGSASVMIDGNKFTVSVGANGLTFTATAAATVNGNYTNQAAFEEKVNSAINIQGVSSGSGGGGGGSLSVNKTVVQVGARAVNDPGSSASWDITLKDDNDPISSWKSGTDKLVLNAKYDGEDITITITGNSGSYTYAVATKAGSTQLSGITVEYDDNGTLSISVTAAGSQTLSDVSIDTGTSTVSGSGTLSASGPANETTGTNPKNETAKQGKVTFSFNLDDLQVGDTIQIGTGPAITITAEMKGDGSKLVAELAKLNLTGLTVTGSVVEPGGFRITVEETSAAAGTYDTNAKLEGLFKHTPTTSGGSGGGGGTGTGSANEVDGNNGVSFANAGVAVAADGSKPQVSFGVKIAGQTLVDGLTVKSEATAGEIIDAVWAKLQKELEADGSGVKFTLNETGAEYRITKNGTKLTFTLLDDPTESNIKGNFDWNITGETDKFGGNHNGGTNVTTPGRAVVEQQRAETVFRIDSGDIKDGATITIKDHNGKYKTVTVHVGQKGSDVQATKDNSIGHVYLTEDEAKNLDTVLARISKAFNGGVGDLTIGVNDKSNGHGHMGLHIKHAHGSLTNPKDAYLTMEDFAKVFEMKVPRNPEGTGLTLQIGDTADAYNQLQVSIAACDSSALGLDGVDISTQAGAQKAVESIKNAINYVSDVRGTLGATQNRLEHTANNLSVMAENIQDAESTIRDTDVAEEMMSYVKNNILIQSAQAMLAQANQIPQGVLQLLG